MPKSVKKNYIYNVSYQILVILTPIIVTPYMARIFGAENIGIYEYVNSVAGYFILFGLLGITGYGQREIAYNQSDIQKCSKVFWEVFFLKTCTMGLSTAVFIIFAFFSAEYRTYYLIYILYLMAQIFDITWFFTGIEEFKSLVIRNTIIKLAYLVFLFVFIKTSDDLILWFVYSAISAFLGNLVMWLKLKKHVARLKISIKDIPAHLKGSVEYLIPNLAASIYVTLSRILLGRITGETAEIGYYGQADKIVKIPFTIISAMAGTMFPRVANYYATKNYTAFKNSANKSIKFVFFLAAPMFFGMLAVSSGFVPWFFGPGFEKVAVIMQITSPTVLALGLRNVLGGQFFIATSRIKYYTIAVITGAAVNLILNLLLINPLKSTGSAIAILFTEFTVVAVHFFFLKKEITVKEVLKPSCKYFIAGAVMFAVIFPLGFVLDISPASTMTQVFSGIAVYFGMLFIMKDNFFVENVNFVLNKVKALLKIK